MNRKKSIVTVGVFDGVHIGHKAVIEKTVRLSRARGLRSIAVTFDPHPLKVLHSKHFVPSLISLKHRVNLIKKLGIDEVVMMKFNKALAGLSAERFIKDILINSLGAREIIVGEDFCFGKGASAGVKELTKIARKYSVKVMAIKHIKKNSHIVSSTIIRYLILKGRMSEASQLLGRPFSIVGTVVRGTRLARKLGYPTANINPHHEVIPPSGVYAVKVTFRGKRYKGVMNIGTRPTFYDHGRDLEPTIEVHIFNFHEKVYGKDMEIVFVRKLRAEKRFKAIDSLIEQIRKDEIRAQALLR